jgi:D-galactose 1-dehydrogenase
MMSVEPNRTDLREDDMAPIKVAIVGLGKIAQDQHIPVISRSPDFKLVAVTSQRGVTVEGVPHAFTDHREMLRSMPEIEAVAICTPPQVRHVIARDVIAAGRSALLEKPPTASLSELADLDERAKAKDVTLFTTWHSQYNRGVEMARDALAGEQVRSLEVTWKEDVRKWHPGQRWIWQAGGFGVFDPGINALSIVTRIMPYPVALARARLEVPANAEAPIAARLHFVGGLPDEHLTAEFDWRQTGPQTWDIAIETLSGRKLLLAQGGSKLTIDGTFVADETAAEYEAIYERFAKLLRDRQSLVDIAPFRLVADAFMLGERMTVEAFVE